jgi:hypothetical protein
MQEERSQGYDLIEKDTHAGLERLYTDDPRMGLDNTPPPMSLLLILIILFVIFKIFFYEGIYL